MGAENNIPTHWQLKKLGEVCEKVASVKRREKDPQSELIYLDIGGIDNQINKIVSHKIYKWSEAPSRTQQIVFVDDVLFSTVRTYMKNIAVVANENYNGQIASSGFCVIRGNKELVLSKFIFYNTLSHQFLHPLNELQTGSSYPAVRDKDVFNQNFLLPPIPEQLTIVSKIEELFSELDNGKQQLETTQKQLKVYRQSLLKAAFEGKLTRQDHRLDGLQEDTDFNNRTDKIREITKSEKIRDSDKGELPKGWRLSSIGEIFKVFIGSTPKRNIPEYWGGNINWLSSGEIAFCDITRTRERITEEGLENSACKVHLKGTVIIAMIGEGKTRGQAAVLKISSAHNQNTAAIRVDEKVYSSMLLYYYLVLKYKENRRVGSGNNQKALNKERVKNIQIPLPTIQEQQLIVQELESKLTVCDKIEETITTALQQAETLRQSILKKALEGKLVTERKVNATR